jgi:ketosteroid isomerase-like protein
MKTPHLAAFALAALLGLAAGAAYAADLTEAQQAAIRQEVIQTLHGMFAAEARLDSDAVWACHADVPGYLWADINGQLYDYAGARKVWTDYIASCARLGSTTKREEVMVLGSDLAFYLWHGSVEATQKDGAVARNEIWTARYLCRRINGAWKIVGGQESSASAQPALPPATAAPDGATTEAAIRDADAAWAEAIASKSIDQTLAFYDPEAVTAGSAMFPARGLPALREHWTKLFARPDFALTWKADRVVVTESATVAYSAGTWSMPGSNENGPYLAVWRKQTDGQWKVLVDAAWRVAPASSKPVGSGAAVEANPPSTLTTPATAQRAAETKTAAQQSSVATAPAPTQPERRIPLTDAPLDRRLRYTAWRTDYYICTGIAFAKSLGHPVEDFAAFVASQHDMGTTSADGLTKIAQLLYFALTNYPKGQVVVTAESDTAITMQFNRAYAAYFKKGPVLGVTLDEFERCLWGHIEILSKRNGFGFAYRIEGDNVTFTISLRK